MPLKGRFPLSCVWEKDTVQGIRGDVRRTGVVPLRGAALRLPVSDEGGLCAGGSRGAGVRFQKPRQGGRQLPKLFSNVLDDAVRQMYYTDKSDVLNEIEVVWI